LSFIAFEIMLEILFEDEWLVAIDKPAGLVVHPTYKNADGTLLDVLRERGGSAQLSVVGRLDKLTSGIVIVAKSAAAHRALQRSWPEAEKDYLAVVRGCVEPERGEIDLPLGSDPADRRRRIVTPDGAPSRTVFERLEYSAASDRSLVRCRLVTGRRHQIRVHFASRGWPIVGDAVYGDALEGFPRHALHAWRVAVRHPETGERLSIAAPVSADLRGLIAASRLDGFAATEG
jgi:23S rRNA pseudouridine1911/1915/1917 synthase